MKKIFISAFLILFAAAFTVSSYADQWDDLVKGAYDQMPSSSKRKTSSGRRLIREKREFIDRESRDIERLIKSGQYEDAIGKLKPVLKVTIEMYGTTEKPEVAERFLTLGVLYLNTGDFRNAAGTLNWAKKTGEKLYGKEDVRLANVYRLLSEAYYRQGDISSARQEASVYFTSVINGFGIESEASQDAKRFMRAVYSGNLQ